MLFFQHGFLRILNSTLPPPRLRGVEMPILYTIDDLLVDTVVNIITLTWNDHIEELVKKASKKLYILIQLKRAHVPTSDLVTYCTCIRSSLDYACPVFHYSLQSIYKSSSKVYKGGPYRAFFPGCTTWTPFS